MLFIFIYNVIKEAIITPAAISNPPTHIMEDMDINSKEMTD